MQDKIRERIDQLKVVYLDIINGYSFIEDSGLYVKHITELDSLEIGRHRNSVFNKLLKFGVPTRKDKEKSLLEQGLWTAEEAQRLIDLGVQIQDNESNFSNIHHSQQPLIRNVINGLIKEKLDLSSKLDRLLDTTCESCAERETYSYVLYKTLFKDPTLSIRVFESYESTRDVDYEELREFSKNFEASAASLAGNTIRDISVMPFFLNFFSYSRDDIPGFFNLPILKVSVSQLSLGSLGQRNLSILSHANGEPPSLEGESTIEDLVVWYDKQFSIAQRKKDGGGEEMITKTIKHVRK